MTNDQRIIKGIETKQRIDSAALRILAHEGFTGLSAKKIAEEANISKSAVFHHYPQTEMIVAHLFEVLISELSEPIDTRQIKSLEMLFEVIAEATFNLTEENQLPYLALFQFYQLALTNEIYAKRIEALKASVAKELTNAILSIEPNVSDNLTTLIDTIVITLDSYGMHYLIDKNTEKYMAQWKIHTKLFLNYLRGA